MAFHSRSALYRETVEQCLRERTHENTDRCRDDRPAQVVDADAINDPGNGLCREPTERDDAERVCDGDNRADRQQSAGGRRGFQQSGVERLQCAATGIDSRVTRRRNTQ